MAIAIRGILFSSERNSTSGELGSGLPMRAGEFFVLPIWGIFARASTESIGWIAITIVIGRTYTELRINLSSIVSSKREDYIMNDTGVMSRTVWVLYHGLAAIERADEPLIIISL